MGEIQSSGSANSRRWPFTSGGWETAMGSNARQVEGRRPGTLTHCIGMLIALATVLSSIAVAVTAPAALAASPPVARTDVARTNAGRGCTVYVYGQRLRPRRRQLQRGRCHQPRPRNRQRPTRPPSTTPPPPASPASKPSPTPSATPTASPPPARRRCGSTPARARRGSHPTRRPTTSTPTKAPRSASPPPNCSANDSDPHNQTLTVVAVSEPSNNGTLTGTLPTGLHLHPQQRRRPRRHRHQLNYLVTDTDGHVTQGTITIRILAADDTNKPPVAGDDVARTNAGRVGVGVRARQRLRPRRRQLPRDRGRHPRPRNRQRHLPTVFYYTPTAGFSGVETITYTLRDTHGLTSTGTATVWVDTGASSTGQSPDANTDYFYAYQGSSVGFTTARLLGQRLRPPQPDPHRGRSVGTLQRRHPHRHPAHRVHLHPQQRRRPRRHRPPNQLPRHRHRRPRHPRHRHHPHPRRRRHQQTTRRRRRCGAYECGHARVTVYVHGNDFDPDGDSFNVVEVTNPAHGTANAPSRRHLLHTPPPASPASKPSPTPSATPTASPPPARRRCGSTPGEFDWAVTGRERPTTSTPTKAPRSASPPPNCSPTTPTHRTRPSPWSQCRNPPTTAPSPAPCPPGSPTPPATTPPRSTPTTNSTTSSPTPTATSPKAPSPSASSPPATPTNHPSPSRTRHARMRALVSRCTCTATTSTPTATASSVVEVTNPAHGPSSTPPPRRLLLHTHRRILRRRNHHLHPPRHPRPHRHRTGHGARRRDRRPAAGGPVGGATRCRPAPRCRSRFGGRPERTAAHVDARHARPSVS